MKRARRFSLVTALPLVLSGGGPLQGQVPPDTRYRTFETEHFRVVFPEPLEDFARATAARAEWAYTALARHFIEPPGGRIALVIADNTDRPNASATPIPGNRITLVAVPQLVNRQLNYYTDWVDLTLVHELTHIFHLDRAAGIWSPLRTLFGRVPGLFPAFYQPRWVVEGLATYYESRLTGAGRAYGSYFDMLLSAGATHDDFLPVDAADGLVPKWPAGQAPYAYGGLYFSWLAETHGDSAISSFTRHGSARLPYTLDWAATPHFGRTLTGGWDRWRQDFKAETEASDLMGGGVATAGQPLSGYAWLIPTPRYSPDGRHLAFTYISPREEAATLIVDGATGATVRRLRRNASGGNTWSPDGGTLYSQQAELADRYRMFNELYALDVAAGEERRVTVRARIVSPDMHPDGRTLVAVQIGEGTNRLVLFDVEATQLTPLTQFEDTVNWEKPRWSPDGTRIAVERWVRGEILDLVVLDGEGRHLRTVTDDEALDMAPAWSPDGRYLLWSSDRDGRFDIYALDLRGPAAGTEKTGGDGAAARILKVTRSPGGAFDPDVSPDGRWLAYVAHSHRGFRVERIPFAPDDWTPAGPERSSLRPAPVPAGEVEADVSGPARDYSPFPSLWPKGWLPLVSVSGDPELDAFLGISTFGADDVRRHSYALLLGWRAGVSDVEGAVGYRYSGLGDPVLELGVSQTWDAHRLSVEDRAVTVVEREREARLAARFLRPRVRSVFSVTPSIEVDWSSFSTEDPAVRFADPSRVDLEGGLTLGFSTARAYPRSISTENGVLAVLALSHRRLADDLDAWRTSAEAQLRAYRSFSVFGFAHHVLAARFAFGASDGHNRGAELFELGGVPSQFFEIAAGLGFGAGSPYPVRAFSEGVQVGDRVASANLEYRFPLWLVGRGHGLWPVFLDRLSAALFVDAGSAWVTGANVPTSATFRVRRSPRILAGAGGELSIDLGLGYYLRSRIRIGVTRPIVKSPQDWRVYVASGLAF